MLNLFLTGYVGLSKGLQNVILLCFGNDFVLKNQIHRVGIKVFLSFSKQSKSSRSSTISSLSPLGMKAQTDCFWVSLKFCRLNRSSQSELSSAKRSKTYCFLQTVFARNKWVYEFSGGEKGLA